MNRKNIKILAIETSCDETSAAVIGDKDGSPEVLSNVISSQIDLHAKTGGIVPEVASRVHMEAIIPVITEALLKSGVKGRTQGEKAPNSRLQTSDSSEAIRLLQNEITHIAVTAGPGLIGSLLVGFNAGKTIAYSLNKFIVPINHIEGHVYSGLVGIEDKKIKFPILALTVSGGHTSLTLMKEHVNYLNIGKTKDDAAGEAFDKVAKLLGLGYPGGPFISKYAEKFREKRLDNKIIFPRPIINDGTFNFSFSGLKTAVLQKVRELSIQDKISENDKEAIAAAFEDAAVDVLVTKTIRAVEKYKPKMLVLAGGVAANKHLRETLEQQVSSLSRRSAGIKYQDGNKPQFLVPPIELCGDNAAMIGIAAYYRIVKGQVSSWDKLEVDANLKLGY